MRLRSTLAPAAIAAVLALTACAGGTTTNTIVVPTAAPTTAATVITTTPNTLSFASAAQALPFTAIDSGYAGTLTGHLHGDIGGERQLPSPRERHNRHDRGGRRRRRDRRRRRHTDDYARFVVVVVYDRRSGAIVYGKRNRLQRYAHGRERRADELHGHRNVYRIGNRTVGGV